MQVNEPPPLPLSLLATPVSRPTRLHLLPTPGSPQGLLPPGWPAASHRAPRSNPGLSPRVSKLAGLSSYEGLGWVLGGFFQFQRENIEFSSHVWSYVAFMSWIKDWLEYISHYKERENKRGKVYTSELFSPSRTAKLVFSNQSKP